MRWGKFWQPSSLAINVVKFICPNPYGLPFERWASIVNEELSLYNISMPVSENAWAFWATKICEILDLSAEGMPSPEMYSDWRGWAEKLTEIAQG